VSAIRPDHPLRKFFAGLVRQHLPIEPEVATYVSGVLVDFTHADNLYRIRNARGKRLEDVAEMMIESNPLLEGSSFVYERLVRRHIGDYTMFLSGLFPEHLASLPRRGLRLDCIVDYIKAGKESYRIVAAFDQFEYRGQAALFRKLADSFELCVFGLNSVKRNLENMREENYRRWRSTLAG
jgi:hypothetical protein